MPRIDMTRVFQASAAAKRGVQCQCGVSKKTISNNDASAPPINCTAVDGNGGTSAQNRLRMSVPVVRPNRLPPSSSRLPVPSDSGTPSTTPTNPSPTPSHCHDAKRSCSSTVPSAAVRIGWKACTSAVGVASTATSAACVSDSPKPCSSAPPSRRNGQDFWPGQGRPVTVISSAAANAAIESLAPTRANGVASTRPTLAATYDDAHSSAKTKGSRAVSTSDRPWVRGRRRLYTRAVLPAPFVSSQGAIRRWQRQLANKDLVEPFVVERARHRPELHPEFACLFLHLMNVERAAVGPGLYDGEVVGPVGLPPDVELQIAGVPAAAVS